MLVGFSTHHGWVTAASKWDRPPQRKQLRDGLPGSWENLFHQTGVDRFFLDLRRGCELAALAQAQRLQRAVGVIYRPETERQSHYSYTRLARQFDAMIHIDGTSALEPLDKTATWNAHEQAPDTFPSGM